MSMLKTLGNFLLGKDPDIFDDQGHVRHKFTDEKWRKWDNRLRANPEYDWHHHTAVERAEAPVPTQKSEPKKSP